MVTPCLPISRNRQYWPSWPPWILNFWESVPIAGELPWTESRCPTGRPFQMSRSSSVNGPICANSSSLANKILLPDTFCFKGFHFDAWNDTVPRDGATWQWYKMKTPLNEHWKEIEIKLVIFTEFLSLTRFMTLEPIFNGHMICRIECGQKR